MRWLPEDGRRGDKELREDLISNQLRFGLHPVPLELFEGGHRTPVDNYHQSTTKHVAKSL